MIRLKILEVIGMTMWIAKITEDHNLNSNVEPILSWIKKEADLLTAIWLHWWTVGRKSIVTC